MNYYFEIQGPLRGVRNVNPVEGMIIIELWFSRLRSALKFTCAKPNAKVKNILFLHISIWCTAVRFGRCEV